MFAALTAPALAQPLVVKTAKSQSQDSPSSQDFQAMIVPFLAQHCLSCHGAKQQKGKLRLDTLRGEPDRNAEEKETWRIVLERLELRDMPPRSMPAPNPDERDRVVQWVRAELKKAGDDRAAELAYPNKGNYVSPPATPARIWRLRPLAYRELVAELTDSRAIMIKGVLGTDADDTANRGTEVALPPPSWLWAHSNNEDNDAVRRGKWVRERLLGGVVPDLPITVPAVLPEDHQKTLRERMRATRNEYCWKCHQLMDPLGLSFELFDHYGTFRTQELIGLGKPGIRPVPRPVDASGEVIHSGDPSLDGPVPDAIALIHKLARSERVTQVFVRHAFRFWMGRNETASDAPVLQAAYRAYQESGGSMKALITSLLTSDAFLYRVPSPAPLTAAAPSMAKP